MGFWHPFGRYTGRNERQILEWKSAEAVRFGWTFWSFLYSSTFHVWLSELANARSPIFVLCSDGRGVDVDPHRGKLYATCYQWPGEDKWEKMPSRDQMNVTNPFKRQSKALAFRVRRVIEIPSTVPPFEVQWFARQKKDWQSTRLPTRGEFLIQRAPGVLLRRVRAILELMPPYLGTLKHVPKDESAA